MAVVVVALLLATACDGDRGEALRRGAELRAAAAEHMKQDLASQTLTLSADEVRAIESLAG